ncbi:Vesicular inhibitory amino acid transporter [Acropora cervicornis]|uniref:Vesicular inhibitory amino acid transporter n=1 Tax=Acropora cervicornis TaxID=6130 RepID=A0AAD9QM31_ACRCE|nr:Vesicular inhibitory amino acid transporter [Acropora cervicornis]
MASEEGRTKGDYAQLQIDSSEDLSNISDVECATEKNSDLEENLTSSFETFWNISNTIQGLPILVIPYAIRNGGYLAVITLFLVATASNYTGKTIVECLYQKDFKSGKRTRVRSSYADVGDAFLPKIGGHLVLSTQFFQLLFVASLYPLLVGRLLAKSFPHVPVPCWLWTITGGFLFLPNIFLRNLSQVAWTSVLTVLSAKIIFITVFAYSMYQFHKWELNSLNQLDASTFPSALGILVASYLSQPFVPLIEGSMRYKEKFNFLMNLSYGIMTLLNVIIGVVAYMSFHPNTAEVVTNNLPEGSFRRAVNVMAAILSFTSYTLPMFTIFEIVEKSKVPFSHQVVGKSSLNQRIIFNRFLLVSVSVLLSALLPAYRYWLAIVGSTAGICLEFVFPPLFRLKIYWQSMTWLNIFVELVVSAFGFIMLISGSITSLCSLIQVYSRQAFDQ